MKDLKSVLEKEGGVEHIRLSGLMNGKFYHTVFIPTGAMYEPCIIFEDGAHIEVITEYRDKKEKKNPLYNYIKNGDSYYIFDTGGPLWFNSRVINGPSKRGILKAINQEKISKAELYNQAKNVLSEYYDFYDEREVDIVFSHIIHTYILELIGKTFYLLLDGDPGTGKSSLQKLMAKLQYHGSFSGKSTVASMARKIHFLSASINFDELDKLPKDQLYTAIGILNTGAYKDATYEITNMDASSPEGQIKIFNTFSAKTFSTNDSRQLDSFLSRCVIINTVENRRPVSSIDGLKETERASIQEVQDLIFSFCLQNGRDISEFIKKVGKEISDEGRYGRSADIFSIIGGILSYFDLPYKETLEYLTKQEELDSSEYHDDRYYITLKIMLEKIHELTSDNHLIIGNYELVDYINKELQLDHRSPYYCTSKSVGRMLRKKRILRGKDNIERYTSGENKGRTRYRIMLVEILEAIERSNFEDLKEDIRSLPLSTPK